MNRKNQFRSAHGCCICGTKTSSSRFIDSEKYRENFSDCFGMESFSRVGPLCNACVLYIKRFNKLSYTKRRPGLFSKVLDCKKGAGPKHMKQIEKKNRRKQSKNDDDSISEINTFQDIDNMTFGICSSPINQITPINSGVDTRSKTQAAAAAAASANNESIISFRVPEAIDSPIRNRYRRRKMMLPVKMENSDSMDDLMRDILQKNSVDLDPLQMHLAVQRELRNRKVMMQTGSDTSSNSRLSDSSMNTSSSFVLGFVGSSSSSYNGTSSVGTNFHIEPDSSCSCCSSVTATDQMSIDSSSDSFNCNWLAS